MAGFGWDNHIPQTARTVAKAFYAGRWRTRSNCQSTGLEYMLFNSTIARRLPNKAEQVTWQLEHDGQSWENPDQRRELEFSWAGYPTKTTARHLSALGLKASCWGIKEPRCWLMGKRIPPGNYYRWWTLQELEELVPYEDPPKVKRKPKFVQLTGDLFA